MKRHLFATLTAARSFRVIASALLVLMIVEAPARAFAEAASAQAATAQSPTAAKLANVPDSIPYEANPYSQVPQTRTMATAIKEALENAGIDPREGSATYDEAPTSDTVTFEGDYEDGDVIVTGRLVNGRIVLTKQFKPLLPSGQLGPAVIGPAVTIPFNPTPTSAVAAASPASDTGVAQDPKGAALKSALEAAMRSTYEQYIKQANALEGERNISGIAIAEGTLFFALLTRDVYAMQLSAHIPRLEDYANQPRAERIAHIRRLQALAKRIQYWWAIRAYLRNAPGSGFSTGEVQDELRKKAREAAADSEKARALGNMADQPGKWLDLASEEIFKLIDQDPIVAASEPFLRRLWSDEPAEDLLEMYDDEVANAAIDAQAELVRVRGLKTVEGITEFLKPQYARTRAAAARTLGRRSQDQYLPTEGFARGFLERLGLERDPLGLNTPMIIGGLIILSLIIPANMPVALAVVAAADVAAGGYALYHDVPHLLDLSAAAANTKKGRLVLGPDAFSELSDEQQIVALGTVLSALGVLTGGRALTKVQAEARAAEMLRRAKTEVAAARAAAARPRGLSPEEIEHWIKRTPENATIGAAGDEVPARQYVRDSVLPEVDEYVGRARAGGVSEQQIAGVLKRARSRSPLDKDFVERIEEELRIEEVNARRATILVDRSDYYFNPYDLAAGPKGDFVEYIGGARPNSMRVVDLQEYSEIRSKMALEARGAAQTWTPEQARIIRDEILPQGDGVKNWYAFEGATADRGLEPMMLDDEFMGTARGLFGPTPSRIPRIVEPAPPRPRGSPRTAGAGNAPPPEPVRGGDTAAGNLGRPLPNQGAAADPGKTQAPPGVTTIDRGQTRIDPAQTRIDPPKRVADPGQTRSDPGQTRIDPGQTVVDPKLPVFKTPRGPERGPGAAMGTVAAAGAGAAHVPFADRIPEGPNFTITGAYKPRKTDDPLTTPPATPTPLVITMNPITRTSLNPAFINKAIRLLLVQYIAAEGQVVTAPAASEPSKDPDRARGPFVVSPRDILGRLASALLPRPIRANQRGGLARGIGEPRPTIQETRESAATSSPPIKIVLTSLGRSSGDAFQMTVLNEGPAPVTLTGDAFVLEPVANVTQAAIDRELAQARGAGRADATLKAYCLEFLKQPPTVGMVFRLAPEDAQRRFANVARIFEASRRLKAAGTMRPGTADPRNPDSYFDDVRQWAIWTHEQGFDEKSYGRAFVAHSRKNVEAAGHKWTRELERAFAGLGTGQWQAVQMVLRDAAAMR